MNYDIRPSYRRTWGQRHPVLLEVLGILAATALATAAATFALYALAEETPAPLPWPEMLATHHCVAVALPNRKLREALTVYECDDGTRVGP